MDESSTYLRSEETAPSKLRLKRASFSSQTSSHTLQSLGGLPTRLKSPLLERHRSHSITTNGSEAASEILAPVPLRHHVLQVSESRHWLGFPPLLEPSSRPVSPVSNATTPPRRRITHQRTFSTVMEDERLSVASVSSIGHAHQYADKKGEGEGSMGKRWVRWMHKEGMKSWFLPCSVAASAWVKWAVGLGSYSGQGNPPMFGDYEAQRHWMELTIHLPVHQWYTYDLQYWGLDYPPLTAYVSWLCGVVGSWIDPTWFTLGKSRGYEDAGSKVFMRASVLALDILVYVPALVLFTRIWQGTRSARTQNFALLLLLLQPALILIDSGHFQYNSVMLGFTLFALNFFATGRDLLGAVCFVFSLGFKQMALYYAPAIGSYLLGKCFYLGPVDGPKLFFRLAAVTTATFIVLFLPFLPPFAPHSAILHPIARIFPFSRGLFEDKVANFWCATNLMFKWKLWASPDVLVKLSAALTAVGFLPSALGLMYQGYKLQASPGERPKDPAPAPIVSLLPYALLTSSMSFFLFSFQVHEKTILLPLLPMTLLVSGAAPDSSTFELGVLVNNVAVFSMWPLLKRDGLGVQYIALLLLWNRLIGYNPLRYRPQSLLQLLSVAVYSACAFLHILELLVSPPARFPDLFAVLNVLVSTPVFALAWLWSIKHGVQTGWALGGLGLKTSEKKSAEHANGNSVKPPVDVGALPTNGIGRRAGLRTQSLGFTQSRRRVVHRSRGSVDLG